VVEIKIYYRKEGKITPLEEMKEPHLMFLFKFTKSILTALEEPKHLDIEVNFIEFNTLIHELMLDNRLKKEEIERGKEGLKRFGGYHIEYKEIPGNLLKEEFKDEKVCYVGIVEDSYPQIILLLHEILHFFSPLDESEIYTKCIEHIVDERCFIKMGVRNILNEYYIEYLASHCFLGYISGLDQINIKLCIGYLEGDYHHLINNLDSQILDKLNIVKENPNEEALGHLKFYIMEFFFKSIMYFLGKWRAFEKFNLKSEIVSKLWDSFINKIKSNISSKMSEFITTLKEGLIIKPKYKPRIIVRYFDLIFIRYFEKDFNEIIEIFIGEKIYERKETTLSLMIKDMINATLPIKTILEPIAAISKQLSEVSKLYQENMGEIIKSIFGKDDHNGEGNNT